MLHFENVSCRSCRRLTGFSPASGTLRPFERAGALWRDDDGGLHHLCANRARHGVCNWMVADDGASPNAFAAPVEPFCVACRLNRVIPDLTVAGNLELWRALEQAKRRCLFTFLELGLPFDAEADDGARPWGPSSGPPLGFRFMADRTTATHFEVPTPVPEPVVTGHEDGVVTINLAEADAIARVRMQLAMRERYRTLLGHFRHETGHYFWERFVRTDPTFATRFRARFGDERNDYDAAVARHYASGAPSDWQQTFISAYATMHPWEDWAESWAHYLHIVDTLETQQSFGVQTHLDVAAVRDLRLPSCVGVGEPASAEDFDAVISLWIGLSVMLNALNRSMGLPDPYPFVLNRGAIEKLRFVHEAVIAASAFR